MQNCLTSKTEYWILNLPREIHMNFNIKKKKKVNLEA